MSENSTIGMAICCIKLKIYEKPDKDSNVVCEVDHLAKVALDEQSSTENFFKVYTEAGIEGYCDKYNILELK